jgi:hypothetical protein
MLAYTNLTELFKLPSPAHLTAVPRASPNQAHSTVADQRRRLLRAVEDVRAYMTAVSKHRETSAQGDVAGRIRPTSRFFANLHTIWLVPVEPVSSWCPISRSQYNWEEEVSLKGEPRNAVCLDGIGHDDDSPNAASSDAARASCPCEIR